MSLDLDAIEQRANAATPGPWVVQRCIDGRESINAPEWDGGVWVAATEDYATDYAIEDAEFIAHAREDIDLLVAEVKQLRRERDHEKRKAADFEGRYETSHASRMHAEDCYRSEHRAVERVRALHRHLTDEQGIEYCEWCDDNGADSDYGHELPLWPCPTIRALDGVA